MFPFPFPFFPFFSTETITQQIVLPAPANKPALRYPLPQKAPISSGFSLTRSHPLLGQIRPHRGIDLVAPTGTLILATHDGEVIKAEEVSGYGLYVLLKGDNVRTLYAHASRLLVKARQYVKAGDAIAEVGGTGLATGPHLHYEVQLPDQGNWKAVDPQSYLGN